MIPRLIGLVSSGSDVLGLLREYVDGEVLGEMDLSERPLPLRREWAAQIEKTLDQLHGNGVVWGDAKATNVFIDKDDKALLIDLRGEFTNGWVDAKLKETKEGDLQEPSKIFESLETGKSDLLDDYDDYGDDDNGVNFDGDSA